MDSSETQNPRLFIAIKPNYDSVLLDCIANLQSNLKRSEIRWMPTENMHITLNFIGNVPVSNIETIRNLIQSVAINEKIFPLTFKNIGYFGKPFPKVIWIGINDCLPLKRIQSELFRKLTENKINTDLKEFSPHLTIGRVKNFQDKTQLDILMNQYKNIDLQNVSISEVILYESILQPKGPEYKILSTHQLG